MAKLLCVIGIVLFCTGVWAGADSRTRGSMGVQNNGLNFGKGVQQDRIAKANELARAGRPESQNAWPDYKQAGKILKTIPEILAKKDPFTWPGALNKQELEILRSWVQENKDALALVQAGSRKQGCWVQYQSASDEPENINADELKYIPETLGWRARLETFDGNTPAAINDVLTLYRMGAHMAGPKTLGEQFFGLLFREWACVEAFTILDHQKFGPKLLKDFQDKLEIIHNGTDLTINLDVDLLFGGRTGGQAETVASKSAARERARWSGLITTLAILRYKAIKGTYPAGLDELVKSGYLKSMPVDPYNPAEKPLVYKKTGNSFVLYTVGENGQDDGGRHDDKWGANGDYVFWPVQPSKSPRTR